MKENLIGMVSGGEWLDHSLLTRTHLKGRSSRFKNREHLLACQTAHGLRMMRASGFLFGG
jgi:hypothetical protein